MFGPNSAGKSAIFDALEFVEIIWDPLRFNQKRANELISRWARQENGAKKEITIAVEFLNSKDHENPWDIWNDAKNWAEKKSGFSTPAFDAHFTLDDMFDDFEGNTHKVRLEFSIIWPNEDQARSYRGPIINCLDIQVENRKIISYGDECPVIEFVEEHWKDLLNFSKYFTVHEIHLFGRSDLNPRDAINIFEEREPRSRKRKKPKKLICGHLALNGLDIRSFRAEQDPDNSLAPVANDIIFYFGTLLAKILRRSSPIVKADRRVPFESECLHFVDPDVVDWDTGTLNEASPAALIKNLIVNRDPHFDIIAKATNAAQISKQIGRLDTETLESFGSEIANAETILHKINQHLSEGLFVEKLYQVSGASTLIFPIEYLDNHINVAWQLGQPALVRLYVTDGNGRKHELYDVGSGIPFVLPVLCALAVGGLVKVQQPELHLHPALQSSLADIFIEESKSSADFGVDNLHLIETHSEHLILRMLRRIRDTARNKSISKALAFSSEELAVYYFDPQVDGGTSIKNLRVDSDGEFIDRWPRGFFAERAAELFDE